MSDLFEVKKNPDLIEKSVLEDIKAEIEQYSILTRERVIEIIDKHISGKEQGSEKL